MHTMFFSAPKPSASDFPFGTAIYDFFSPPHLAIIFFTIVSLIVCFSFFSELKAYTELVLRLASIFTVTTILLITVYCLTTGEYNIELFLPFHLCNLFFFLLPLAKNFPRLRPYLYDYMVCAGIVGCLLCTVFPLTSMAYYPVFHPISMLVWLHHFVIGITGVFLLSSSEYKPFDALRLMIILSAMILAAVIVNHYTGANFLFLNPAYNITPLNYIKDIFGEIGIWAGVAIIYGVTLSLELAFIRTKPLLNNHILSARYPSLNISN